jgi:DNA-binding transcriptional regulator YhcF (GntR family)
MRRSSTIAGIMALVFFFSVLVGANNAVLAQGPGAGHHGKGFCSNLTEEQRDAVQEKVKEMQSQDATREEIHSAVAEMLKGYGIEVPEECHGPIGFGPGKAGFEANLTEEQRDAIHEKIKEMRDQGATREETHAAVAEMLKGYGIEVPEDSIGPHGPGGFGPPGPQGFFKDLTEEQRDAVEEKMKEMRDQGASREEIRSAVAEMLKGYGIEVPEDWHGPIGFGHGKAGFKANLTEEQREAIREKVKEMRSQGASGEEIRAAKAEMLKGYGIELPEKWGEGRQRGQRFGFGLTDEQREIIRNLTDEQRQTLRKTIREMRSQGATREEIRAALAELFEGFGIELPEGSESTSSETAPAKLQIQAQSYPNPFNPQTEIAYSLPEDSYVKLTIYNIQGQKVTTLVDEHQSAGTKKVVWDGCDESGESVASGVYLYRIEAGPYSVTNRMVLLK